MFKLTRRKLLAGGLAAAPAIALLHETVPHDTVHHALGGEGSARAATPRSTPHAVGHGGGVSGPTFRKGEVVDHSANGFNPTAILRDFDYGRTSRLPNGRTLRQWEVFASEKEVEIAPGVKYPAWTFDGRIPGPTLRAREGDLLRVKFSNGTNHPHTMHFHGIHPSAMDGVPDVGRGIIKPGETFMYEFDAVPFGLHLYHCHVGPLAEHIARGMYGTFIIDPKQGREDADELMMQLNGFNTTFDFEGNQVYAVNTVAFHYVNEPIQVKRGQLVRMYVVNILEFDPINSFHLHANFFDYFPTGTRLQPTDFTDTIILGQGQRGILELRFPHTGMFMFHAHKTEFSELGWTGFFEVT